MSALGPHAFYIIILVITLAALALVETQFSDFSINAIEPGRLRQISSATIRCESRQIRLKWVTEGDKSEAG